MHKAWFSINSFNALSDITLCVSVDYAAQTFRDNEIEDPLYDKYGNISRLLQKQYKGYKILYPAYKQ